MKSLYLDRYAWPDQMIHVPPVNGIGLIVVIPCYDEPHILNALESLEKCTPPKCGVEIVVVLNHSENEDRQTKQRNFETAHQVEQWMHHQHQFQYHLIRAYDLPEKKAGVGLARKIGMDEAVRRFKMIKNDRGIIICFDADCTCTNNYLTQIYKTYLEYPDTNAALVYFEHHTNNPEKQEVNQAIINYELHLRYYVNALRYAHFPFAYHTVGSCITVRSDIYQKQGGMNTRKAGEDFYFLQKLFPLGNIVNINTASVFPSSRPSNRVPFGTGRAVRDMIKSDSEQFYTYNPRIFVDFKALNKGFTKLWYTKAIKKTINEMPESIRAYLVKLDFINQTEKLKKNHKHHLRFEQAMYNWFNGFKALKYVHFATDHYYSNVEVADATRWILEQFQSVETTCKINLLMALRDLDKSKQ